MKIFSWFARKTFNIYIFIILSFYNKLFLSLQCLSSLIEYCKLAIVWNVIKSKKKIASELL